MVRPIAISRPARGRLKWLLRNLHRNETFLFTDTQSFQQYWHIYDSMSRDGTATEILAALSEAEARSLVGSPPSPAPNRVAPPGSLAVLLLIAAMR